MTEYCYCLSITILLRNNSHSISCQIDIITSVNVEHSFCYLFGGKKKFRLSSVNKLKPLTEPTSYTTTLYHLTICLFHPLEDVWPGGSQRQSVKNDKATSRSFLDQSNWVTNVAEKEWGRDLNPRPFSCGATLLGILSLNIIHCNNPVSDTWCIHTSHI